MNIKENLDSFQYRKLKFFSSNEKDRADLFNSCFIKKEKTFTGFSSTDGIAATYLEIKEQNKETKKPYRVFIDPKTEGKPALSSPTASKVFGFFKGLRPYDIEMRIDYGHVELLINLLCFLSKELPAPNKRIEFYVSAETLEFSISAETERISVGYNMSANEIAKTGCKELSVGLNASYFWKSLKTFKKDDISIGLYDYNARKKKYGYFVVWQEGFAIDIIMLLSKGVAGV